MNRHHNQTGPLLLNLKNKWIALIILTQILSRKWVIIGPQLWKSMKKIEMTL